MDAQKFLVVTGYVREICKDGTINRRPTGKIVRGEYMARLAHSKNFLVIPEDLWVANKVYVE